MASVVGVRSTRLVGSVEMCSAEAGASSVPDGCQLAGKAVAGDVRLDAARLNRRGKAKSVAWVDWEEFFSKQGRIEAGSAGWASDVIRRLARRRAPDLDADDVAQESLLRMLQWMQDGYATSPELLRRWCPDAVRTVIRMQRRRRRFFQEHRVRLEEAVRSSARSYAPRALAKHLREAMAELPELDRALLQLRYLAGLTVDEVLKRLEAGGADFSRRYLERRLQKALARLRRLL